MDAKTLIEVLRACGFTPRAYYLSMNLKKMGEPKPGGTYCVAIDNDLGMDDFEIGIRLAGVVSEDHLDALLALEPDRPEHPIHRHTVVFAMIPWPEAVT